MKKKGFPQIDPSEFLVLLPQSYHSTLLISFYVQSKDQVSWEIDLFKFLWSRNFPGNMPPWGPTLEPDSVAGSAFDLGPEERIPWWPLLCFLGRMRGGKAPRKADLRVMAGSKE